MVEMRTGSLRVLIEPKARARWERSIVHTSTRTGEDLNPLSGQRGAIATLLPVTTPLRYSVVLRDGAVVRETCELSSAIVHVVPRGAPVHSLASRSSLATPGNVSSTSDSERIASFQRALDRERGVEPVALSA